AYATWAREPAMYLRGRQPNCSHYSNPTKGGSTVKHRMGGLLAASTIALSLLCAGGAAQAADPFMLRSSAFEDNGKLAVKNAGNARQNPDCVGDNVSPPLNWSNPPDGTTSYAMIMYDPEAL